MSKATESSLSALHNAVATYMLDTIRGSGAAECLLQDYPDLPIEVREFIQSHVNISPSFLSAATKFLKDNEISCDLSRESSAKNLQKVLEQRAALKVVPFEAN